jgi:hypothetical protein
MSFSPAPGKRHDESRAQALIVPNPHRPRRRPDCLTLSRPVPKPLGARKKDAAKRKATSTSRSASRSSRSTWSALPDAQHRGAVRVVDLQPALRPAGLIRQVAALGDDAFEAELARRLKDPAAVAFQRLAEKNVGRALQQRPQQRAPPLQRLAAQVGAVMSGLATGEPKPGCALAPRAIARCLETLPAAFPPPASRSPWTPAENRQL